MYIKKILIKNFRNYENVEIDFSNFSNLILGANAQGKTNLLEAIYYCANGKTFKNNLDNELINYNKNKIASQFKIFLEFEKNNRFQNIEIIVKNNKKKQIKKNDVPIKRLQDLFGCINIILFSPDDLKLIKASPVDRRKFLDREIASIYPNYIIPRLEYEKVLEQRNKLLKNFFIKEIYKNDEFKQNFNIELDIWTEKIIDLNIKILIERMIFLKKLSKNANKVHNFISNKNENLELFYDCCIDKKIYNEFLKYDNYKSQEFKKFINKLKIKTIKKFDESKDKDIKLGYTNYGIHKDDINFFINKQNSKKFASQGQQRTAILSIKIAEIEIIKEELDDYPIFLLDDVMSELDETRQTLLINKINGFQNIITSTDINKLNVNKLKPYRRIDIKNGNLHNSEVKCE